MNILNRFIWILSLITLCFWTACDDEEPPSTCTVMEQNASWTTEDFKTGYDIQFPSNYEGLGMVGFEGNFFAKNRTDDLTQFSYNYCGPLYCEDFGNALATPIPTSVTVIEGGIILSEIIEFCDTDNNLFAILYHDNVQNRQGQLYMNQGGNFLEALSIIYDQSTQQEVEDIIKTISEN